MEKPNFRIENIAAELGKEEIFRELDVHKRGKCNDDRTFGACNSDCSCDSETNCRCDAICRCDNKCKDCYCVGDCKCDNHCSCEPDCRCHSHTTCSCDSDPYFCAVN